MTSAVAEEVWTEIHSRIQEETVINYSKEFVVTSTKGGVVLGQGILSTSYLNPLFHKEIEGNLDGFMQSVVDGCFPGLMKEAVKVMGVNVI